MSTPSTSRRRAGPTLVLLVSAVCSRLRLRRSAATSLDPPSAVTAAPSPSATRRAPSQVDRALSVGRHPDRQRRAATNAIYDAVETAGRRESAACSRPAGRSPAHHEAELRTMLTKQFDEETPPAYLAAQERLYKALGLIPVDAGLRDLTLDLLSGGVAGLLPRRRGQALRRLEAGTPGATERFYFAHEYDHALQDQNFTVFKDQKGILDQSDRILARQAVYEGDATLPDDPVGGRQPAGGRAPPDSSAPAGPEAGAGRLSRAPAILRETARVPVHDRAHLRLRRPRAGRLAGRRRASTSDAGIDRADPPSREVRGRRGAGRGDAAGGSRQRGSGRAGPSRSRTRSASSSSGSGSRSGVDRPRPRRRPRAGAAIAWR